MDSRALQDRLMDDVRAVCDVSPTLNLKPRYCTVQQVEGYLQASRTRMDAACRRMEWQRYFDMNIDEFPLANEDTQTAHIGENVLFTPKSPKHPHVLFSCHKDFRGGKGANDNGSGMAVLMEVLRHAIDAGIADHCTFMFFDGEEMGLSGSKHHKKQMEAGLYPAPDVLINIDSVGAEKLFVYQENKDNLSERLMQSAIGIGEQLFIIPKNMKARCDHQSFRAMDFPAVTIIGFNGNADEILATSDPRTANTTRRLMNLTNANTAQDTLANLRIEGLANTVRIAVQFLTTVASPSAPLHLHG